MQCYASLSLKTAWNNILSYLNLEVMTNMTCQIVRRKNLMMKKSNTRKRLKITWLNYTNTNSTKPNKQILMDVIVYLKLGNRYHIFFSMLFIYLLVYGKDWRGSALDWMEFNIFRYFIFLEIILFMNRISWSIQ